MPHPDASVMSPLILALLEQGIVQELRTPWVSATESQPLQIYARSIVQECQHLPSIVVFLANSQVFPPSFLHGETTEKIDNAFKTMPKGTGGLRVQIRSACNFEYCIIGLKKLAKSKLTEVWCQEQWLEEQHALVKVEGPSPDSIKKGLQCLPDSFDELSEHLSVVIQDVKTFIVTRSQATLEKYLDEVTRQCELATYEHKKEFANKLQKQLQNIDCWIDYEGLPAKLIVSKDDSNPEGRFFISLRGGKLAVSSRTLSKLLPLKLMNTPERREGLSEWRTKLKLEAKLSQNQRN